MEMRNPPTPAARSSGDRAPMRRNELRSILSSLSHELCRPLSSLRAGFDLLLAPSEDVIHPEGYEDHILTMISLCDDLLELTHSYLDFASMVEGTRPITWGVFSFSALFSEIERQFAPQADHRGIVFEACPGDPDVDVQTDASRLQQILGNLASNALKFTAPGGSVRLQGHVDDDSWSISIIDTGAGIPAEGLQKVFEPFYRLARDEHAGVEGNGLGLTICRELVEQLGGEITLESVVARGTTVTIRFPLSPGAPLAAKRATGPISEDAPHPSRTAPSPRTSRQRYPKGRRQCPAGIFPSPLLTSESSPRPRA